MNTWTPVTIPATPDYAREPEGIPYTPEPREAVKQYQAAIERHRERLNAADARRATCPKSSMN